MKKRQNNIYEISYDSKKRLFYCHQKAYPHIPVKGSYGTCDKAKIGYDNIIILANKPKSDVWYKLCEETDKFTIFNITKNETFNLDIPSDYGVPRIWFRKPIKIDYSVPTADIFGYMESEEKI